MTADFRFFVNKQGLKGATGEKGDKGFSPSIVEEVNTLTDYRLKIINEFDEFVTDNLRGSDYFDVLDPTGTYLRFNPATGKAYTGTVDRASSEIEGVVRLATSEDISSFDEHKVITPALFVDSLSTLIVSPDGSIDITQNPETSLTELRFNSSTLDAIRTELNQVKEDLTTESQVRGNADNQLQSAINSERRERENQDSAIQRQLSSLSDNYVTLNTEQNITGHKSFNEVTAKDLTIKNGSAGLRVTSDNTSISINPTGIADDLIIGNTINSNGLTLAARWGVKFEGDTPLIKRGSDYKKILSQDTVEAGNNVTIEQTTNGIKISSTGGGGGGAIIDDGDPATDKVYSSSKTSDLVGELGNEVNGIAGRLNTLEGEVVVATNDKLGLVKPDNNTIKIDSDGKIKAQSIINTSGMATVYGQGVYISPSVGNVIIDSVYPLQKTTGGELESTIPIPALDNFIEGTNVTLEKNFSTGNIKINCTASTPEVDNVTIEVNDSGKLQTTVDINALQERVEELQLYKFPNATIIGTPTINNGQITDFSTTSYLQFPFEFKSEGRTWLLNGSFDTDTNVTTQQNIIDSLASVALAIRNGRLVLALSTNGTSFNLGEHESMSDIEPNTKYYFRLSFSGTQYLLSISTDKQEWLPEIIVTSSEPIASKTMTISSSGHPFSGVLNLNDWNLTVANTLVWQGMDDVGIASRMDVNASNITEAGKQVIKDLAGSSDVREALELLNGGDETLFSTRADVNLSNITDPAKNVIKQTVRGIGFPSDRYINLEVGADGASYTAPANGYFTAISGLSTGENWWVLHNTTNGLGSYCQTPEGWDLLRVFIPARKNDVIVFNYGRVPVRYLRFIYAEGEEQ